MTSQPDRERLRRLLGRTELDDLRRRLRSRYERGEARDAFTLTKLTPVERRAIEGLLGRRAHSGASMRVKRSEFDASLARAGLARNLREALELLDGSLTDRRAFRIQRNHEWQAVIDGIADERMRTLLAGSAGAALLKRLAGGDPSRGRDLVAEASRVLGRLPAKGVSLSQLAAETLGDSHALDAGQPVAALVLRACFSEAIGESTTVDDGESAGRGIGKGDSRRDQWAQIGVSVNELAAPALCLNLSARDRTVAGRVATAAASTGDPVHLSLRVLLQASPRWDVDHRSVYVCENPTILATAADRLGRNCQPLVCTDGMPTAAQQTLLRQLVECGAQLQYHGDFDWGGVRIGNFVMRNFGAVSWRFGAVDYRTANAERGTHLSKGERTVAIWDTDLDEAMIERGIAIHEEALVDTLLEDLILIAAM